MAAVTFSVAAPTNLGEVLTSTQALSETDRLGTERRINEVMAKLGAGGLSAKEAKVALKAIELMAGQAASYRTDQESAQKEQLKIMCLEKINKITPVTILTDPTISGLKKEATELGMLNIWEKAVSDTIEANINIIVSEPSKSSLDTANKLARLKIIQNTLTSFGINQELERVRNEIAKLEGEEKSFNAKGEVDAKATWVRGTIDTFRQNIQSDLVILEQGGDMLRCNYLEPDGKINMGKVEGMIASIKTHIGPESYNQMLASTLTIAAEAAKNTVKILEARKGLAQAEKELKDANKLALRKGLSLGVRVLTGGLLAYNGFLMASPLLSVIGGGLGKIPGLDKSGSSILLGLGGLGILAHSSTIVDGLFKGYDMGQKVVDTIKGQGNKEIMQKIGIAKTQLAAEASAAMANIANAAQKATTETVNAIQQSVVSRETRFAFI